MMKSANEHLLIALSRFRNQRPFEGISKFAESESRVHISLITLAFKILLIAYPLSAARLMPGVIGYFEKGIYQFFFDLVTSGETSKCSNKFGPGKNMRNTMHQPLSE